VLRDLKSYSTFNIVSLPACIGSANAPRMQGQDRRISLLRDQGSCFMIGLKRS
jgi:hypothetical protein